MLLKTCIYTKPYTQNYDRSISRNLATSNSEHSKHEYNFWKLAHQKKALRRILMVLKADEISTKKICSV